MTHQWIEIKLKELEKRIKLLEEQEPFMNKPCVAHQVCHEDKVKVLDKIRAEITDKSYLSYDDNPRHIIDESWVLEIIDKYKLESEDTK